MEHPGLMTSPKELDGRVHLPEQICFRITRYCNARCGFCLAPPDGAHPNRDTLAERVEWLLWHGVRTIHFCGGEPTIHPALADLIEYVHHKGGKTRLTTNGILIPDPLISVLRNRRTHVKVSLHGDREHHDKVLGREAFNRTTENLRRLLAAGVPTSVQTTVISGGEWVVEWVAAYCRSIGVRRLSILPFIPRGRGSPRRAEYELTMTQLQFLRELVRQKRRALNGTLELRWLDFTVRPVPVIEADGTVILEGATEASDQVLGRIPLQKTGDAPSLFPQLRNISAVPFMHSARESDRTP
jgi:MoaA/NifB/PqqE/SkfB family radical SAM enzyme